MRVELWDRNGRVGETEAPDNRSVIYVAERNHPSALSAMFGDELLAGPAFREREYQKGRTPAGGLPRFYATDARRAESKFFVSDLSLSHANGDDELRAFLAQSERDTIARLADYGAKRPPHYAEWTHRPEMGGAWEFVAEAYE